MVGKIRACLVDLSGTLHIDSEIIKNTPQALQKLRDTGIAVRFVTNTTKESKNVLLNRLRRLGFQINEDEIFTSLGAARRLIEKNGWRPLLIVEKEALEDFAGIQTKNPNCVVVGLAPSEFHYEVLNDAFRLVLDGAPIIAIHKGRYYRRPDGLALGPGPFVTALEFATDKTSTVVGKPDKSFFLSAFEDLGLKPEEVVMIGDDVRDDIYGAMQAGLQGILVKTGKYREGDEKKIAAAPTLVAEDFPDAVDKIIASLNDIH